MTHAGASPVDALSSAWAMSLPEAHALSASPLRLKPGVRAALDGGTLWIRGEGWSHDVWRELRAIASTGCFFVLADRQLVPIGRTVPTGRLPNLDWRRLETVLVPEPQAAALPGRVAAKLPLSLVRCDQMRDANWLLVSLDTFRDWALSAPAIRVSRLSFACTDDGRCLVRGEPLPPIPAERLVEQEGVVVPAGLGWKPALSAMIVREVLDLNPDELAVWFADGHWERLDANDFVRATRAALRATVSRTATFGS